LLLQSFPIELDPTDSIALSQLQLKLKFVGAVSVVVSHALLASYGPSKLKRGGYVNFSAALDAKQCQLLQFGTDECGFLMARRLLGCQPLQFPAVMLQHADGCLASLAQFQLNFAGTAAIVFSYTFLASERPTERERGRFVHLCAAFAAVQRQGPRAVWCHASIFSPSPLPFKILRDDQELSAHMAVRVCCRHRCLALNILARFELRPETVILIPQGFGRRDLENFSVQIGP
jgi:hypothetical protein